ncbi:MAG: hypothetical protein CSB48_13075 [Proteobacteria bacterium]|nr:MAG: hypothetical protein CSB48_13075 [Pseudomonadota bacterium]
MSQRENAGLLSLSGLPGYLLFVQKQKIGTNNPGSAFLQELWKRVHFCPDSRPKFSRLSTRAWGFRFW